MALLPSAWNVAIAGEWWRCVLIWASLLTAGWNRSEGGKGGGGTFVILNTRELSWVSLATSAVLFFGADSRRPRSNEVADLQLLCYFGITPPHPLWEDSSSEGSLKLLLILSAVIWWDLRGRGRFDWAGTAAVVVWRYHMSNMTSGASTHFLSSTEELMCILNSFCFLSLDIMKTHVFNAV